MGRGLSTAEINQTLCDLEYFGGVLAINQLPLCVDTYPKLYIINTDPIELPGKHWVAVCIDDTPEFFDSMGKPPSHYGNNIEYFMLNNSICNNYMYNSMQIQSYNSDLCGQYCIYYCMLKHMGYSIHQIVHRFNSNLIANDHIVYRFSSFDRINI